jgi:long-chain fatty acid transport protein
MQEKNYIALIPTAILTACSMSAAYATNGMLMEGYGPESTAMGGTSMAYDNGAAAMVNNPATLSRLKDGESRFDLNLGLLRPDVSATIPTPSGKVTTGSSGDSYFMPAVGWATHDGQLSYGFGVFSQGGMGTEYDANSPMQGARSELGVGAFLMPLSINVNDKLSIGATAQYVWGGLDLIMGMPLLGPNGQPAPGTFFDFMPGSQNALGSASGSLVEGLGQQLGPAMQDPSRPLAGKSAVFNFSNDNDFSGKANGAGLSARLGFAFQASPSLSFGGAYQAKTDMSDWEGTGTMSILDETGAVFNNMNLPGTYKIKDFQFPSTLTLGMAYTMDKWLFAADITQIDWSSVMKAFNLNFTVDPSVPNFGGAATDISLKQEWDDQTVLKLGAAYELNKQLTLRGGLNLANNPIPDEYLNPLFPAIIENHVTLGATWKFSDAHSIGGSLAIAPEVDQTNNQTQAGSSHSQSNLQIMYSYRY